MFFVISKLSDYSILRTRKISTAVHQPNESMEIIANINHLLGDNLKQTVKPNSKLKIAALLGLYRPKWRR